MVPKDWQHHPIGRICQSIVPGRNKPKTFVGTIPWVTTPEFSGRYIPSVLQRNFVDEKAIQEAGSKIIPAGCVVIACVGELGLTAITKRDVVINQQLHAFVCPDYLNNEYLAYWLETQKPYMESVASKTTIPYMNKANCESIPVAYPSLDEQTKIARILSSWDKSIEYIKNLIENSKAQKKALMQQLLTGNQRLPGFEKNLWREYAIKQMGEVVAGGTPDTLNADYWNGEICWTTPTDITALKTRYITDTARKITEKGVKECATNILPINSLLVCTRATIGSLAINKREIATNGSPCKSMQVVIFRDF